MNNEEKMLQLVLSDQNLSTYYKFNPEDYPTLLDALRADIPVVVAIAKIINAFKGSSEKSLQKEIYTELFNYFNQKIL